MSTFEPHPPFAGPFYDLYDPESIPLGPAFMKHPPEDASKLHRIPAKYTAPPPQMRDLDDRDAADASVEQRWRAEIAHYWDNITHTDKAVGRMLQALDDAGIADNTIVVYTSEHGDQLGAHHLSGKGVMYEESVKVPLLMRVPWMADQQTMIPGRFSQIDVVPTLLDLIGVPVPSHLQGESRTGVMRGEATLDGNDVMIDWNGVKTQPPRRNLEQMEAIQMPHRSLITADGWKLTLGDPENGELYDMNADPHEMTNLYRDRGACRQDSASCGNDPERGRKRPATLSHSPCHRLGTCSTRPASARSRTPRAPAVFISGRLKWPLSIYRRVL